MQPEDIIREGALAKAKKKLQQRHNRNAVAFQTENKAQTEL